jgi:hypothetical protein
MRDRLPVRVRRVFYEARTAGLREFRRKQSLVHRASYWLQPRLFAHGQQWCALKGVTVQCGVAGFGLTPAEAFRDFDQRSLSSDLLAELEVIRASRLSFSSPLENSPAWFLQPTVNRDGRWYWVLYGSNIPNGVVGFGRTLDEAYMNFDEQWFTDAHPLCCLGTCAREEESELLGPDDDDPSDWWKRSDENQDS